MTTVPPATRKHILIVEDDEASGPMLARLLEDEFDVDLAKDGMEGLAAALRLPGPDLIITDVTMPNLDGISMVRLIRSRTRRKVPVFFLTARADAQHVIRGIGAGARHYLLKPIDFQDLEHRIHRALGLWPALH